MPARRVACEERARTAEDLLALLRVTRHELRRVRVDLATAEAIAQVLCADG